MNFLKYLKIATWENMTEQSDMEGDLYNLLLTPDTDADIYTLPLDPDDIEEGVWDDVVI